MRNLGVLVLLGAVWGASFLFIKIGVSELAPVSLVALRVGTAALLLLGILFARGLRLPRSWRLWGHFAFTGLVGLVVPYMLITWGEQSIPSGMAAILNATTPLFTLLLAYVWTREEALSGLRLLGVAIGFAGVVVAVGGSRRLLASAATYADEINIFSEPAMFEQARAALQAAGRDVPISVYLHWYPWPADPRAELARWAALGASRVFVSMGYDLDLAARTAELASYQA